MIFCPDWTTNSFSLVPPPEGSVLAWKGELLLADFEELLEEQEAGAYERGYRLFWDDIGDLARAYGETVGLEKVLRSSIESALGQNPSEQELYVTCLYDGTSWELVVSFLRQNHKRCELRHALKARGRAPRAACELSAEESQRYLLIQRVVTERVVQLHTARRRLIDEATHERWPIVKLRAALDGRKIDANAVAAGLDLSGDYLTAWLRNRGLPNTHALVRNEKLSLATRLAEDGVSLRTVALQLGFSDIDYFKRLLAEHRRAGGRTAS